MAVSVKLLQREEWTFNFSDKGGKTFKKGNSGHLISQAKGVKLSKREQWTDLISQAKGELTRLLLAAGNIDYEDFRCV